MISLMIGGSSHRTRVVVCRLVHIVTLENPNSEQHPSVLEWQLS